MAPVFDNFPTPPIARLLGWTLLDSNADEGWAKLAFDGKPEFLNPAGYIQGGILSAMLDDTMGPTVLIATHGAMYTATIDMNVSFLAPAKVGRIYGDGRVVQLGKTVGFVEAQLRDESGVMLARATSSSRLVPTGKLPR